MKYRYIAVEGNIGAGKTTLAGQLAAHYNAKLVLEEFADNPFLPKFYKEPERFAFPLELSFLTDRYQQLKDQIQVQDLEQQVIVSDYVLSKTRLFAKINLEPDEYQLFERLFDIIHPNLTAPDVLIYLQAPVQHLQQNIRRRGRSYELNIQDDYLRRVEEGYQQFLSTEWSRTIVVNADETDFLRHPDHFKQLVDFLDQDAVFQTHYFEIGR